MVFYGFNQLLLNYFFYSKKCTDKQRATLEGSNINTVTDVVTETSVENRTKVDTNKLFSNCSVCCKSLQESSAVSSENTSCSICGSHICKNKRNCSIFRVKSNALKCSYCYEFNEDQDAYDWIFEGSNRNILDKVITTSELSTEQNGPGNSKNNVMLESDGNFYKFHNLDHQ